MGADKSVEITGLLKAWGTGDQGASGTSNRACVSGIAPDGASLPEK